MFPSEAVILMAIAVPGGCGKKLLTRPLDVVGEYVDYLYDSLADRGYLKRDGSTEYQLTSNGKKALFEFLYGNKTSVEDTVRALQQLGIEINMEVADLEREAIKVS